MRALLFAAFLCSIGLAARPSLTGRAENLTAFFLHDGKLRHHRYELELEQTTPINSRLLTVVDGRARADLALLDSPLAPRHDYSAAVRNDELLEAEPRRVYLDFLSDQVRIKAGLQEIDWIEAMTPYASDILTPLDLRNGGFGDYSQVIIPVVALDLNHKLLGGNMEWLLVPFPRSDRLPQGDNGYGYYPYLQSLVSPAQAAIADSPIPRQLSEIEGGARYHLSFDELEISLLGYYGHSRSPVLTITPQSPTQFTILQSYPRVATLGVFTNFAHDALVLRLFGYFQPSHDARLMLGVPSSTSEQRIRVGAGLDYVFSKHLKIYSEVLADHYDGLSQGAESSEEDIIGTIRMTNESIRNVFVSLDLTATTPHHSWLVSPEVAWTVARYRLAAGAHFIHSDSPQSLFNQLAGASQIYTTLRYLF